MKKNLTRNEQAQQRYSEILAAAKELFAANGYHSTSTRSINKAVGVADGLLYHYFPEGKQQILEIIIQREVIAKIDRLLQSLGKLAKELPLEKFLHIVGEAALEDLIQRDQAAMLIFFREQQNLPAAYQEEISTLFACMIDFLTARFQRYIDNGEMKPLDAKLVTMQFVGAYQHFIMMKMLGTWPLLQIEEEHYAALLAEHLLQCWKS